MAPTEVIGGGGGGEENLLPTLCFEVETLKEEKWYLKVIKGDSC